MSTKIYDAYKLKNLSAFELGNFISELKSKVLQIAVKPYNNLFVQEIVNLIDNLCIYDTDKNFDAVEELLKETHHNFMPFQHSIKEISSYKTNIQKETMNQIIERFSFKYYTVGTIVKDILERKTSIAEITHSFGLYEYDFLNKIVLFPTEDKILCMVFGRAITSLMSKLCFSDDSDCVAFREKYGLEDYHYQNQTDRPENITEKDWKQREIDWDNVMPSWIPKNDGIVITILDSDLLGNQIYYSDKHLLDITSHIPKKEERVKDLAYKTVKDKYINKTLGEENAINDINKTMEVSYEFRDKFTNGDSNILSAINEEEEKLSKIIPDLSNDEDWDKPIISFLPNYIMKGE